MPITAQTIPGGRIYERRQAPLPVRAIIAPHAFANGLHDRTVEKILDTASRTSLEGVSHHGRSWLVPLATEEQFADSRTIKIKSATDRGGPPVMAAFDSTRAVEIIDQPPNQLMVDGADKIQVAPVRAHPTGTGFLSEAVNEYLTMTEAREHNVPTHQPIGIGQFLDLSFSGEEVGFVIISLNNRGDNRIGYEIINLLEIAAAHEQQGKKTAEAFEKLRHDSCAAARTLRLLHESGLTHTHPSLANFDPVADRRAQVCDFTNARSYRGMSKGEFTIRVFNDIRHLYLAAYRMANQGIVPLAGIKTLFKNLELTPPFDMPFCATSRNMVCMSGYFGDANVRHLGWKKIQAAMKMDSFIGFTDEYWQEDTLPGLDFMGIRHPVVQLFIKHAGSLYDRLRAAE